MEFVSYGQVLNAFGEKKKSPFKSVDSFDLFAAGVYWPEGRHPILPFFQHSIIPLFHYSWLEEEEWLAGNPLLSTICRNYDTLNYEFIRDRPIYYQGTRLEYSTGND